MTRFARSVAALVAGALLLSACGTFATTRSAEIRPGTSVHLQASLSSPPGEGATWFWSMYCTHCDHPVPGVDVGVTHSLDSERPLSVGAGLSGIFPYVEGYVQLGEGGVPWGIGARAGLPVFPWAQHQLFGRLDLVVAEGRRVLLTPGLFLHHGSSPNQENDGHFVAFVQGIGYLMEGPRVSFTPSATAVVGRGQREQFGQLVGPFHSAFVTAAVGITFRGRRVAGE